MLAALLQWERETQEIVDVRMSRLAELPEDEQEAEADRIRALVEERRRSEWEGLEQLAPALESIYRGWHQLFGDRAMGFSAVGPIAWTAQDRWLERHGYRGDARDRAEQLWSAMEAVYQEHMRSKASAATEQ